MILYMIQKVQTDFHLVYLQQREYQCTWNFETSS